MKEKINELIPKAIQAITDSGIADIHGDVKKEFKGYIASMGASIIQAGLLPTLAFYQNDSGKNAHSSKVLNAIMRIIAPNQSQSLLISYVIVKCNSQSQNTNDIRANELNKDKLALMEEDIMNALIVIKLALRTFKIEGDE